MDVVFQKGITGISTEWNLMCMAMNIVHLGYRLSRNEIGIPFQYRLDDSA